MDEGYLLTTSFAEQLYEQVKHLPLIDYHNHLSIQDIQQNRQFESIYDLWLASDPYKHRVMRICGIDEELITGSAPGKEKFRAFCGVYPRLIGGPLFDWCAMELNDVLGIHQPIDADHADWIWDEANEKLKGNEFRAGALVERFHAEFLAPCASILDNVMVFQPGKGIVPSLRGDDMTVPTLSFLQKLSALTEKRIDHLGDYLDALDIRLAAFHRAGCRFSDHALDDGFTFATQRQDAEQIFQRLLGGAALTQPDQTVLSSEILLQLAVSYQRLGWTMQLHIGAMRFTSTRLRKSAGPAGGFAGIGSGISMQETVHFLDAAEMQSGKLPSTILYTLNPGLNAAFAVLCGSFAGVVQGPAWWWCDHIQGMRDMLENYAVFSVLSTFPGMTTDSRSLLSLTRHDYFRRVLCGWLGEKMQRGEMPRDEKMMGRLAENLCYFNAKERIK